MAHDFNLAYIGRSTFGGSTKHSEAKLAYPLSGIAQ